MRRTGVTVIEVMFAIGVATVGLLGIMMAYTVALYNVGKANIEDRATRLGMTALEDFQVRGMGDWRTWRNSSGASVDPTGTYQSYAIDPIYLNENPTASTFPDSTAITGIRQMQRISVSNATTTALAREVFVSHDHLTFDIPQEQTLPPSQLLSYLGTDSAKRQYEGELSWMATVTPRLESLTATSDEHNLSVIVFHRRDFSTGNERVVNVAEFFGDGINGGEVLMTSTDPTQLELKPGNWVLLAAEVTAAIPVFRWYKVLYCDDVPEEDIANSRWILNVSLHGADWPRFGTTQTTTVAVIIPGIVDVRETTIQLNEF